MRRFTPSTITDVDALLAELAEVRRHGLGYDVGEAISDVHCVAAPVRDEMGVVIAAVSITVPVNRFMKSRAEFSEAVRAAATEIATRLAEASDVPAAPPLDDPTNVATPPVSRPLRLTATRAR